MCSWLRLYTASTQPSHMLFNWLHILISVLNYNFNWCMFSDVRYIELYISSTFLTHHNYMYNDNHYIVLASLTGIPLEIWKTGYSSGTPVDFQCCTLYLQNITQILKVKSFCPTPTPPPTPLLKMSVSSAELRKYFNRLLEYFWQIMVKIFKYLKWNIVHAIRERVTITSRKLYWSEKVIQLTIIFELHYIREYYPLYIYICYNFLL